MNKSMRRAGTKARRVCLGFPLEVFASGSDLEVIFYYAEIDLRVEAAGRTCSDETVFIAEHKFLLIHSRRGEHSRAHAAHKPFGYGFVRIIHLGYVSVFMLYALGRAVADRDDADELFAFLDKGLAVLFAERQGRPAGVKP